MAITKEDLREFQRFANGKLENGGAESLVELVNEWESRRRTSDGPTELDAHTQSVLAAAFPATDDSDKLQQTLARRGGVTTTQLLDNAVRAAEQSGRE